MNPRVLCPSMSSLLAFEASARNRSFTRSAKELCLSQSAVSRQIQVLEESLGVTLFERTGRHILLTEAGKRYAEDVAAALAAIRQATERVIRLGRHAATLNLAVLPAFGSKWLLPRLPRFYSANPGIQVHIHSRVGPVDFDGELDAAIVVGEGRWQGLAAYPLFEEELVPVVSGRARLPEPLRQPADLAALQLLRVVARPDLWRDWFRAQGLGGEALRLGPQFELTAHLLQAVCAGLGAGLVPRFLVEDELASGALRIPLDSARLRGTGYYLIAPGHRVHDEAFLAFRDWLLGEL
ncbi:LysR substrate-binding domain-containing protein [Pseudomonas citronellolis]|uniref:LysR substrate-binding domain-containing protein n=1 Tax=Pseudomonas citronellolis TaxID=53408 RepID=UPI0022BA695C|nr:LysR substrate-binding domain-containing protein [Pseudomonas citronellolis]WBG61906.1 LysR family transcriptional regulator [Pseudomonas citronellolis]